MRLAAPPIVLAFALTAACSVPPSGVAPGGETEIPATSPHAVESDPHPAAGHPTSPQPAVIGSLVVRLVDPAGAPWPHPTQVTLRDEDDPDSRRVLGVKRAFDGRVEFPSVPRGHDLGLVAFPQLPTDGSVAAGTPRPRTVRRHAARVADAGETIDLVVGPPCLVVTGRLLDADGHVLETPVCGQLFGAPLEDSGTSPSQRSTREGGDRFRLEFDAELPPAGVLLRLTAAMPGINEGRDIGCFAWNPARGAQFDVGDVRVVPLPLAVAGIVVAPTAASVDWSRCQVTVATHGATYWTPLYDLSATPDARGAFEIRGRLPEGERLWLVGCSQEGLVFERAVEVRPGATDHEVRLVRSGVVTGSVKVPNGVEGWGLLEATLEGDPAKTGFAYAAARAVGNWSGGRFSFDGLRPGQATILVRAYGVEEPILRCELVVAEGTPQRNPLLEGLAPTRPVTMRKVSATEEDGDTAWQAVVWTRPAGSDGPWLVGRWENDAKVHATLFGDAYDVVVLAPGRAVAEGRGLREDAAFVLHPAAAPSRVTVRLAPDVELPAPPLVLSVALVRWGDGERRAASLAEARSDPRSRVHIASRPLDARRSARFRVAEPGRWQAAILVQRCEPSGGHGSTLAASGSTEVTVTEEPQDLEIVLRPDPRALQSLCTELAR